MIRKYNSIWLKFFASLALIRANITQTYCSVAQSKDGWTLVGTNNEPLIQSSVLNMPTGHEKFSLSIWFKYTSAPAAATNYVLATYSDHKKLIFRMGVSDPEIVLFDGATEIAMISFTTTIGKWFLAYIEMSGTSTDLYFFNDPVGAALTASGTLGKFFLNLGSNFEYDTDSAKDRIFLGKVWNPGSGEISLVGEIHSYKHTGYLRVNGYPGEGFSIVSQSAFGKLEAFYLIDLTTTQEFKNLLKPDDYEPKLILGDSNAVEVADPAEDAGGYYFLDGSTYYTVSLSTFDFGSSFIKSISIHLKIKLHSSGADSLLYLIMDRVVNLKIKNSRKIEVEGFTNNRAQLTLGAWEDIRMTVSVVDLPGWINAYITTDLAGRDNNVNDRETGENFGIVCKNFF
jgi:hypothetical protein